MFRKSLTCDFPAPIFHPNSIRLIRPIRPFNFLTRAERPCKTATLGSSFGPKNNLKEPVSSAHLARSVRWWIGKRKKRNTCVLPLPVQRYEIIQPEANVIGKRLTCWEGGWCCDRTSDGAVRTSFSKPTSPLPDG